jgi:hypothetical protein
MRKTSKKKRPQVTVAVSRETHAKLLQIARANRPNWTITDTIEVIATDRLASRGPGTGATQNDANLADSRK